MPQLTDQDYRKLADGLLASVLSAASLQMRYMGSDITVMSKADTSPVTAADHESETVLLSALEAIAPSIPVVAEERIATGKIPAIDGTFFAVDPIDGTKEFIGGRAEFTINIGLIYGGIPQFGLIYAPALSAMYLTTASGKAAYCHLPHNALISSFSDCRFERIQTRTPEPGALRALTSRSLTANADEFLKRVGVTEKIPTGSSLKFCLIAHGQADIYARFGPTNEWDTAAGQAILTAAGGSVVTMDDEPLSYGKTNRRFLNPEFVAWGRHPSLQV